MREWQKIKNVKGKGEDMDNRVKELMMVEAVSIDEMVGKYAALKEQRDLIDDEMNHLKNNILEYMDGENVQKMRCGDFYCTNISYVQNKIDTKLLKQREPEIAAAYTYAIPIRQLRIKEIDE